MDGSPSDWARAAHSSPRACTTSRSPPRWPGCARSCSRSAGCSTASGSHRHPRAHTDPCGSPPTPHPSFRSTSPRSDRPRYGWPASWGTDGVRSCCHPRHSRIASGSSRTAPRRTAEPRATADLPLDPHGRLSDQDKARRIASWWVAFYLTNMGPLYRQTLRRLGHGPAVDDILSANPTHRTAEVPRSAEVLLDELTVWGDDTSARVPRPLVHRRRTAAGPDAAPEPPARRTRPHARIPQAAIQDESPPCVGEPPDHPG